MGEINIYFVGICTHMQDVTSELPGFKRRVVLVNGRVPREINSHPIPPHIPTLRIATPDLMVAGSPPVGRDSAILDWELNGCHVDVANVTGDLTYDPSFECCIPHLKRLTPNLPKPSVPVVIGGESQKASCYFEMTAGVLSAGLIAQGAVVSMLKVETTDEAPILRVRGFRKDTPQEFQLRSGAQVALVNAGIDGDDDPNDFLLHYETAEYIPPDAAIPTSPAACCKPLAPSYIIGSQGLGLGCSNSAFP
jgi:hypothetical protein